MPLQTSVFATEMDLEFYFIQFFVWILMVASALTAAVGYAYLHADYRRSKQRRNAITTSKRHNSNVTFLNIYYSTHYATIWQILISLILISVSF